MNCKNKTIRIHTVHFVDCKKHYKASCGLLVLQFMQKKAVTCSHCLPPYTFFYQTSKSQSPHTRIYQENITFSFNSSVNLQSQKMYVSVFDLIWIWSCEAACPVCKANIISSCINVTWSLRLYL